MEQTVDRAFLGQGWAFPIGPDPAGDVAMVADEQDIRQAIGIILGTNRGERIMRPEFGAGLNELVFETINTTTTTLVRHRVTEALTLWEPRIDQIEVQVSADPPRGRLLIDIHYRVRSTNTFYNLVYPFYLLEGEKL